VITADGGSSGTENGNSAIQAGLITSIFRVRGYNGTSLDAEVEVEAFGATMNGNGAIEAYPKWDGEDEWVALSQWVDRDATGQLNVDNPLYYDAHAYVNNWILVAQFERYFVPVLTLSQVSVTARILRSDERWSLVDGTTAGRVKTDEFVSQLEYLKDPETDGFVCTDSPSYDRFKQNICATSDISYLGPDDGTAPCDGTSWAWKFETKPARLDGVFSTPVVHVCPPDKSPAMDSCNTLGATSETRSRAASVDAGSVQ
jgi:hypothetical protein